MISVLATGGGYQIKLATSAGSGTTSEERTIGFATKLDWSVMNGQKRIHVVDSPFPAEIAQGAAPSFVQGTMQVYMPKGQTLESMNVAHFRHDANGEAVGPFAKYVSLRVYDRLSRSLVLSLDFVKFGQSQYSLAARSVMTATVSFEGILMGPGNSNS